MKSFRIHYDENYGINCRKGWSAIVDGSVVIELTSFWKMLYYLIESLYIANFSKKYQEDVYG